MGQVSYGLEGPFNSSCVRLFATRFSDLHLKCAFISAVTVELDREPTYEVGPKPRHSSKCRGVRRAWRRRGELRMPEYRIDIRSLSAATSVAVGPRSVGYRVARLRLLVDACRPSHAASLCAILPLWTQPLCRAPARLARGPSARRSQRV